MHEIAMTVCNRWTRRMSKMTVPLGIFVLGTTGLLSCGSRLVAQTPPPTPQNTTGTDTTLLATLSRLRPVPDRFLLAVGAETVYPAQGAPDLSNRPPPDEVAAHFGDVVTTFGTVHAFGTQQMTVLNPRPTDPDIWDGIPSGDAMRLFLSSLDAAQYQALTSQNGLGFANLRSRTQQGLYLAILNSADLRVQDQKLIEDQRRTNNQQPVLAQTYPQDLPKSRLRFGQRVRVLVPQNQGFTDPVVPGRYYLMQGGDDTNDALYGVPARADIAHTPKTGQLDFQDSALRVMVPLTGAVTVQDLISRIAAATHREIYADQHYENRSVTVVSASSAAPAADLLQGLAFCVGGTYRKVGPAYVLTNAIVGVGTVRGRWQQFEADGNAMREQALVEAEKSLSDLPEPSTLPILNPELGFTPEQTKAEQAAIASGTSFPIGIRSLVLPYQKLTQAQQREALNNWDLLSTPTGTQKGALDGRNVHLKTDTELQLLIPSLDEPVVLGNSFGLFNERLNAERPHPDDSPYIASLTHLSHNYSYKAVLAQPTNATQLKALASAMQKADFSELWLDCSLPNASGPAPLLSRVDSSGQASTAMLQTASGIHIDPVLNLFLWRQAPQEDADLTVLGETSSQAEIHALGRAALIATAHGVRPPDPGPVQVAVSLFSPDVQHTLTASIKQAAAIPHQGGMVWQAITLPGYHKDSSQEGDASSLFGYTLEARLQFLRKWHTDPIDIDPVYPRTLRVDTGLPDFDDQSKQIEISEQLHWDEFREDANHRALQALYRTAQADSHSQSTKKIFLLQRNSPFWDGQWDWYGLWTGGNAPIPDATPDPEKQTDAQPDLSHHLALIQPNLGAKAATGTVPLAFYDLPDASWGGIVINLLTWLQDPTTSTKALNLISGLTAEKPR